MYATEIYDHIYERKHKFEGKPVYEFFKWMDEHHCYQSYDFTDDVHDTLCCWEVCDLKEEGDVYDECVRELCKHIELLKMPLSPHLGYVCVATTAFCEENLGWLAPLLGINVERMHKDEDTYDDALYEIVQTVHEDVFTGNCSYEFYEKFLAKMREHYGL